MHYIDGALCPTNYKTSPNAVLRNIPRRRTKYIHVNVVFKIHVHGVIIFQEAEPGTNVTRIEAESTDPSVTLTFTFIVNDELREDASKFDIDPDTGLITVKEELDRETQQRYEVSTVTSSTQVGL